ncbi:hypothetical protein Cgig2_024515 [Carnegiea gigantea]|uniref:Uncharacterized protein n=1 Tax=Carnegiea gigantea TaxID=171969 RepID=A0A9Q1GN42_9CARY|nr:hypothetical protein Cgig2_024515 [Carnegiea gigantea]
MPPPGHGDESESDDELRSKKCVKAQPKKKEDVQKSPKPPVKSRHLSKSLKKKEHVQKSAAVPIEGPKSVQSVPKPAEGDTKHKEIFQSRMSPSGFVTELLGDLRKWLVDRFDPYSVTLYVSPDKRIEITPMDVHITLALPIGGRKVEEFYGKKPKDAKYNEVLDAWRKD